MSASTRVRARYAVAVLLFFALLFLLTDLQAAWVAAWRARDHVTAAYFLDPTSKDAAPLRPVQSLLIAESPSAFSVPSLTDAPLLALHFFSTGSVSSHIRRGLIRHYSPLASIPEEYRRLFEVRFVLGRPKKEASWSTQEELLAEQGEYGDLIFLDEEENMNEGKSVVWMQTVGREHPAQWVFKADDDTLVLLPNLLDEVLRHSPQVPTYVGTSLGRNTSVPIYFTGALYGFSWPVLGSVGAAQLSEGELRLVECEDMRVGELIHSLPSGPHSARMNDIFPCLPACQGEELERLQSFVGRVNRYDHAVHSDPRTGVRFVNVLSRIHNWRASLWPWQASARTALAWHRLKEDEDYIAAFEEAAIEWDPPFWLKEAIERA